MRRLPCYLQCFDRGVTLLALFGQDDISAATVHDTLLQAWQDGAAGLDVLLILNKSTWYF